MVATVETIDFDAVFKQITDRLKKDDERRFASPLVRIWDGDWNYVGEVHRELSASFQRLNNETGIGTVELPSTYYLARWATDAKSRAGQKNVFVTVDYRGMRWSGTLDEVEQKKDNTGYRTTVLTFLHDYEHLKHILAYSNPFLPPELQFPRIWILFGPSKWALKLCLLVNIMRLESSLWALPDDPLNPAEWFNFDQSTWSQVVAPLDINSDNSQFCISYSRFKSMHDVSKAIVADAQLSWVPRRWLEGDPPPWEGANVRHGCLVWELVDNSGWDQETSFEGNIFTGLERAFINISSDGMTQGIDVISDPTFPDEYSQPGFLGTLPQAPGIILRDSDYTAITTSSFKWKPATDVGYVAGGHSMPGVNEAISAAIQMAGDLIAAIIGVPPVGGAADAILKPLYTDVVLAFMKWKDTGRAEDLGWSHFHETWCDGSDRAYTLSALIALRAGMWRTREQISHTVEITDGCEGLRVGALGYGNCDIGSRIGVTVKGFGQPGQVWVDQVSELTLGWARDTTPGFKITIGSREIQDPVVKGLEMVKEIFSITQELGVL